MRTWLKRNKEELFFWLLLLLPCVWLIVCACFEEPDMSSEEYLEMKLELNRLEVIGGIIYIVGFCFLFLLIVALGLLQWLLRSKVERSKVELKWLKILRVSAGLWFGFWILFSFIIITWCVVNCPPGAPLWE